jgi:hypothetical protein
MTPHPSKLRRALASLAVLALLWALCDPAAGFAAGRSDGEHESQEISPGGSAGAGAVPSAPERSRSSAHDAPLTLHDLDETAASAPSATRPARNGGGAAPGLTRWRLAHGTATSSP